MADKRELKDWLKNEGYSKYKEASKLSTEDSKDDPETEPYKSKYAAREILLDLKKKVEYFTSEGNPNDIETKLKSLECTVQYDLALNYIDTDEKGTGERLLYEIKEKLDNLRLEPEFCSLVIKCCQQLGILWSGRGDYEKSLGLLNEAEKLFNDYKNTDETPPSESLEHFQTLTTKDDQVLKEQESRFENLHTHTLYYTTQVYNNLGENKKSSRYCHNTLHRQLMTKLYDPAEWAVNCATLSQYHITRQNYKHARHCLVCASIVIAECPITKLQEFAELEEEGEDERKTREHIPQAKANVALCWSKYCLDLLSNSAQKSSDDIENSKDNSVNEDEMLRFDCLDVTELESEVPCEIAKNYDQARILFLTGQRHLNAAKEFYQLDGYVISHVEIIQDHSQLFKQLAFFDSDLERQCKMCKRRVDMLASILGELNPQHYLLICRQLIYEIATVYSDMADLKTCIIKQNESEKPSAHQIKKINSLLENSAKFYMSFLDSMKQEGKLPEKYDESVLRVALLAHLCLARIYSKEICLGTKQRIGNYKKSLELYKYIVEYCDGDEDGARRFAEELQACREMVELLPFRIAKITQGLQ